MDPFIGEIRVFPFGVIPRGWAQCNGQLLPINQNQALFALLGTYYGGNGVNNFGLPNFQGTTLLGAGASYPLGTKAGTETVTLTVQNLPQHNHLMKACNVPGNQQLGGNDDRLAQIGVYETNAQSPLYATNAFSTVATNLTQLAADSVSQVGGGQPHENRMPYLSLNVCIAITGIFPSRS